MHIGWSQCSMTINAASQEALDSIMDTRDTCRHLNTVNLSGDVFDLSSLEKVESIENLTLDETSVTDLSSLKALRRVSAMSFIRNSLPISSAKIPNLDTIITSLVINDSGFSDLSMFSHVKFIGALIVTSRNRDLPISGLDSLNSLTDLQLNGRGVKLRKIPKLARINLISFLFMDDFSISSILDSTIISEIDRLLLFRVDTVNLDSLEHIGIQSDIHLFEVNEIQRSYTTGGTMKMGLQVSGGMQLKDLSVFSDISPTLLSIRDQDSLVSLSGMRDYSECRSVSISGCDRLTDISALEAVDGFIPYSYGPIFIGNLGVGEFNLKPLSIRNNPMLDFCAYPSICQAARMLPDTDVVIEGNAAECLDKPAVLQSCLVSQDEVEHLDLMVYPNPTSSTIKIVGLQEDVQYLTATNILGMSYYLRLDEGGQTDMSHLPSGMYGLSHPALDVRIKVVKVGE